eukprot:COSAG06_NODE_1141_length_10546_cov_8.552312_3_plen_398_part_00
MHGHIRDVGPVPLTGATAAEEGGGSACCGVRIVRELSEIVPVLALVAEVRAEGWWSGRVARMSEPEPEPAAAFTLAEVRLCAFDLDGTLCRPDNTVSPRTKAAVQAVREAGVKVVLATGRTAGMAKSVPRLVDGNVDYVVLSNGAETMAMTSQGGWEQKVSFVIPPSDLRTLVLGLRKGIAEDVDLLLMMAGLEGAAGAACLTKTGHAKLHMEVGADGANRFTVLPPHAKRFFAPPIGPHEGENFIVEDDVLESQSAPQYQVEGAGVLSLMVDADLELVKSIVDRLDLEAPIVAVDSGWEVGGPAEIKLVHGTEKPTALQTLCEDLGISRMQTMAFGDGPNDRSMLKWAGCGVAMGNASDDVKAAADVITATNLEDGVAEKLEELLAAKLNPGPQAL